MGGFLSTNDFFVIDLDVVDNETGEVIAEYRFSNRFDTQKEAEAFIDGRVSAKTTVTHDYYSILRVGEDDDPLETAQCVWTVYSRKVFPKPHRERARVVIS